MSQVLDAAYPAWSPASLKASSIVGVCRYLSWLPNSKVIKQSEYQAYIAAGIPVLLNWESTGRSWRNGYAAGVKEGAEARRQARALGHPDSRPVIQSIDEDCQPGNLQAALAYQRGFNDGGGVGPQGCYSTAFVLDAMHAQGLISIGWQTNARGWYGNGPDSPHAGLLQRTAKDHPWLPANSYDQNDVVKADWGQHPAPHAPAPVPHHPTPKPHPVTGGTTVNLKKTKTKLVQLVPAGLGCFVAEWDTGSRVAACWATVNGPAPAPYGPDDWWHPTLTGQVRVQMRGNNVIVTGFFSKWKVGDALPQAHAFAVPA